MHDDALKKEAKIKKLKELRKMMQKRMVESFSNGDSKKMISKVLDSKKEEKKKEDGDDDDLKIQVKEFFLKKPEPSAMKTKIMIASKAPAKNAPPPPPPRKK